MPAKRKPRKRRLREIARDHDLPIAYLLRIIIVGFMAWQGIKSGDTDLTKWNAAYLAGLGSKLDAIQKVVAP